MARPLVVTSALACLVFGACQEETLAPQTLEPEPGEELSGGDTTVFDESREAFARPARNLDDAGREVFALGDHLFSRTWVTAPASAAGNDGLGPLYNATNCSACHFKDGRGEPPKEGTDFVDLLLRLSIPGEDAHGGPLDEPRYGGQLNPFGILGVPGEAVARVEYVEEEGTYLDGELYSLRRPIYSVEDLAYGPMESSVMMSPRIAPHMVGLGLLEAVAEETIVALADEADDDGDGISGRPNWVFDVRRGDLSLGRFGWKANQPTVEQQNAGAFLGDLGVTSELFGAESCTGAQTQCGESASGGSPELDESKLRNVTFYARTLAVPARRDVADPEVLAGRELFHEAGCSGCHIASMKTHELDGHPELANQVIWPYTDLLLHDMGEPLADGRPDFEATGSEWRTPPLWGIGLVESVNKHTFFLHDGRARGFAEAILWHGGEAEHARENYRAMNKEERGALLRFLESL